MTGDFNALCFDNVNSSSELNLNDARIKRFTQLKNKFLIVLVLLISYSRMILVIVHLMTNNIKLLRG